jgi:hypothetical protein
MTSSRAFFTFLIPMTYRFLSCAVLAAAMLAGCGGTTSVDGSAAARPAKMGAALAGAVQVFAGPRENYTITSNGFSVTVTNQGGAQTQVVPSTILRFDDQSLVADPDSAAASLFRLYQAAFNRAPDVNGLSYWVGVHEAGASLNDIAAGFTASAEFQQLYGVNPTPDVVVDKLYNNVLHRAGDSAGMAYWLTVLIRRDATLPQVLAFFAEGKENKDGTQATIRQGIPLYEKGVAYKPVARAGAGQEVLAGDAVQLDGSASSGADSLAYDWTLLLKPAGSQAVLSGANTAKPTFTPDVPGNYLVALTVQSGAARSTESSLLVTAKVIPDVWKPLPGAVPASGNYVYLQGTGGDYIVGNRSYLYRPSDATFTLNASGNYLRLRVAGDQDWDGDFKQSGTGTRLAAGYYGDLTRYPFQNSGAGGVSWTGEGRGCNTVKGWFVIDKVRYTGDQLSAIDLRFEQRCEGGTSALHGQVHWDASDTTGAPGPVTPIPTGLWSPVFSAPAGNYVYLESTSGDYIGGGKSYLHTEANGTTVTVSGNSIRTNVNDRASGDWWSSDFVAMNTLSDLQVGYYGGLQRYPFHNAVKGGFDWSGNGRGCNTLTAWYVIDKITYVNGNVKELDARFEQHCEGGTSALRGKVHWVY